VVAFNVAAKAFDVKEYDRFRMGSAYCEMNNCTSDWARLTAKEYDAFRVSPTYIDSVQEMNLSLPDDPIVIQDVEDDEASPVSTKGMEKISNSCEEDLVMLMDTSIFLSPISPADDTWPTIARDSILHWDTIAREATFHAQEKNGLFNKDEIVSEHVAYSQQPDMLPNAAILLMNCTFSTSLRRCPIPPFRLLFRLSCRPGRNSQPISLLQMTSLMTSR
jgi:hypothetical protein